MEHINAVVSIRQTSLNSLLKEIDALVGCSLSLLISDAPEDCTDYVIRVFTKDGDAFYDFPCSRIGNRGNSLKVTVIGTAFKEKGRTRYEIRANDSFGNQTGFGVGEIEIGEFSTGTARKIDSNRYVVDTLLDDDGAEHPIVAMKDECGKWTFRFASPTERGSAERRRVTTVLGEDGYRYPIRAVMDEVGKYTFKFVRGGGDPEIEKINLSSVMDEDGVFHSVEAVVDEHGVMSLKFRREQWPKTN